jgi:type II secretory pathway component GspD/PulD (secretin)
VAILKAIQTDTDTKILARPKVLTLDNESAVIRLTAEEAIGFQTASQSQTGTTTAEPERTTTGVVLVVTPQVNEHNYITMLVEPTVTKTIASKITAPSGQATPRDPKTRSSRTMVRVRSGDTLVVGGLIDHSEEESLQQVPVLSGIPFIGEVFKNTDINNAATEVIVFMTPRILDEPSEGQLAAAPQSPLGLREQEAPGRQQDAIERTLNDLE